MPAIVLGLDQPVPSNFARAGVLSRYSVCSSPLLVLATTHWSPTCATASALVNAAMIFHMAFLLLSRFFNDSRLSSGEHEKSDGQRLKLRKAGLMAARVKPVH
jgi:hypothetical protein